MATQQLDESEQRVHLGISHGHDLSELKLLDFLWPLAAGNQLTERLDVLLAAHDNDCVDCREIAVK